MTTFEIAICCIAVLLFLLLLVVTLYLIKRSRWYFWIGLNAAVFLLTIPKISFALELPFLKVASGSWWLDLAVVLSAVGAVYLGYRLQAIVLSLESEILDPQFQKQLGETAGVLKKRANLWDYARMNGIPDSRLQALITTCETVLRNIH